MKTTRKRKESGPGYDDYIQLPERGDGYYFNSETKEITHIRRARGRIYTGTAKCHPDDEFSPVFGLLLSQRKSEMDMIKKKIGEYDEMIQSIIQERDKNNIFGYGERSLTSRTWTDIIEMLKFKRARLAEMKSKKQELLDTLIHMDGETKKRFLQIFTDQMADQIDQAGVDFVEN